MDELEQLIRSGPDPRFKIKSRVLARYQDITAARTLCHTWESITLALGLPSSRWRDVAATYRRIQKGVETGRIKLLTRSSAVPQQIKKEKKPLPTNAGKIPADEEARRRMLEERGIRFE